MIYFMINLVLFLKPINRPILIFDIFIHSFGKLRLLKYRHVKYAVALLQ